MGIYYIFAYPTLDSSAYNATQPTTIATHETQSIKSYTITQDTVMFHLVI
jgi:hypothetical protein